MPHPEREHALQIELATALADAANLRVANDAARATVEKWLRVVAQLRENLNATLLERDAMKESLAAARRECEVLRAELAKCGKVSAPHSQMRPEKP